MSEAKTNKKQHVKMENLSVRQLRQRIFNQRSHVLFGSPYTFVDDIPEQIEKLKGDLTWETFSEEWDILWVGLDVRAKQWIPGRHNSPFRKLIAPISIVLLDDRTKRMQVPAELKQLIGTLPLPPGIEEIEETEEDRIISEHLSGKVVIDETDEEKALREVEATLKRLAEQKGVLERLVKKNKK